MFRLLVDTCVWLDIVKDQQQQTTIGVLEELVRQGEISLIVPRIVLEEFARNKARVIQEGRRSLSGVLKRAKQAVEQLGNQDQRNLVLPQLNAIDFKLPSLGESAVASVGRVEKLLRGGEVIETSDAVKIRAVDRAIGKRAPFHRQKNSMADAVLIEIYGDFVAMKTVGIRFGFVTHNVTDFSHPASDTRLPHPDFEGYFSKRRSLYFTSLSAALQRVQPEMVSDLMLEQEWEEVPRELREILKAMDLLVHQVWYNRHQGRKEKIERGEIKIVEKETFPIENHEKRPIQRDIWEGALAAAAKVEKQYGLENLGPWTDFEWGMINGKLSALRWVLGDEWDMLDT